ARCTRPPPGPTRKESISAPPFPLASFTSRTYRWRPSPLSAVSAPGPDVETVPSSVSFPSAPIANRERLFDFWLLMNAYLPSLVIETQQVASPSEDSLSSGVSVVPDRL